MKKQLPISPLRKPLHANDEAHFLSEEMFDQWRQKDYATLWHSLRFFAIFFGPLFPLRAGARHDSSEEGGVKNNFPTKNIEEKKLIKKKVIDIISEYRLK